MFTISVTIAICAVLFYLNISLDLVISETESSVTTIAAYSLGKTFATEHRTSKAGVRHAYDNKFTNNVLSHFPLEEMQYSFTVYPQHV